MTVRLCRFSERGSEPRAGVVDDDRVWDLSAAGASGLQELLEADDPAGAATRAAAQARALPLSDVELLAPVERQEIWAAGVTYLRSKVARMEESDFSATAYDRVYDADRPELFFKSLAEKAVPHDAPVGIRRDASWNVPEPELALVLNSRGRIAGYTIGNDMSSRDIEGANLLYLPQAKVYDRSCALGPWITLGATEAEAREWSIQVEIHRAGAVAFSGRTSPGQIKRSFEELAEYLFRCQTFANGAVLLTGTGVIPPDSFSLAERDVVRIDISGIGLLSNPVMVV